MNFKLSAHYYRKGGMRSMAQRENHELTLII